jgi:lipopolysaccharide/colanic/teichoic acid biosynthesis glycosyltransferase
MYADARERFPELYDYATLAETFDSIGYKPADDPRNTRFGRFIRRTTLDELPNLINVVKGDVSFVGPRPELPEWALHYTPEQRVKFSVKPGITGLAVVTGRNNLTIREQIACDVEYTHRRSFWFDMRMVALTFWVVVRRVGAE